MQKADEHIRSLPKKENNHMIVPRNSHGCSSPPAIRPIPGYGEVNKNYIDFSGYTMCIRVAGWMKRNVCIYIKILVEGDKQSTGERPRGLGG